MSTNLLFNIVDGRAVKAGVQYFLIVFGTGFALAPVRELWAAPRFGERLAELMEMPLMLLAIVFAARWTIHRLAIPPVMSKRLPIGIIALGLLLVAELCVVYWVRALTFGEYVEGRDPVSAIAYLVMLVVFGAMPAIVMRRQRRTVKPFDGDL